VICGRNFHFPQLAGIERAQCGAEVDDSIRVIAVRGEILPECGGVHAQHVVEHR